MKKNASLVSFGLMSVFAGKFDANAILAVELNTEDFDLERTLIPEGEHRYKIGKPTITSGEKEGRTWAQLTLPLVLAEPDIYNELNVEEGGLKTRIQLFLDLDDEGKLAKGPNMNINLMKAFEAAGLYGTEASIMRLESRLVVGNTKTAKSDSGAEYNVIQGYLASAEA